MAYRRALEHPFLIPGDDVYAAYKYVVQNASKLGLNSLFCLGGTLVSVFRVSYTSPANILTSYRSSANLALSTVLRRLKNNLP